MAAFAKGLPVVFVPEKTAISAMRHDVVYHGCRGQRAAFQAIGAMTMFLRPTVELTTGEAAGFAM